MRNSITPLLHLPQELQDCIQAYVCGKQLIHIKNSHGSYCYIYKAIDSPRTIYLQTLKEPKNGYYKKHTLDPEIKSHASCYRYNKLNLKFQRTSRQIYYKTIPLIYKTNIFLFSNAMIWFKFIITLRLQFRALIKYIQPNITISKLYNCREQLKPLTIPLIYSLSGLKILYISIQLKLKRLNKFKKAKEYIIKD